MLRFNERCLQALTGAQQEALYWQHNYLGCEHLLMGLLHTSDGVAATVLRELKVDGPTVRTAMGQWLCSGKQTPGKQRLPRTRRARKVLRSYAKAEARKLRHVYIGTEHLLLALMHERENLAARILTELGLSSEQVRQAVLRQIAPGN